VFDQRFTRQGRPPGVEFAQFRPGKNNAVAIDDQIAGAPRHYNLLYISHPSGARKLTFEANITLATLLKLRQVAEMKSFSRACGDQGDVSAAGADSFLARCLADAGCAALARSAAFLRSRYALRRLRLSCTRCCCPTGSLSVETIRNAI
jgi:hypothetical protein